MPAPLDSRLEGKGVDFPFKIKMFDGSGTSGPRGQPISVGGKSLELEQDHLLGIGRPPRRDIQGDGDRR